MKKGTIWELIRSHAEGNEAGFRHAAYEAARSFDENGDHELARSIMALLGDGSIFVPQEQSSDSTKLSDVFYPVPLPTAPFPLPRPIEEDLLAITKSISTPMGIHKFLFHGAPGTGKTEAVKHIARMLRRALFAVDFALVIDSRLGQTAKNIGLLFNEMKKASDVGNVIFLFDEIDAIALDRTNQQDVREMGRVTSTVLRYLDELPENIILFATTNLIGHFDKALLRRFDALVDFNRYEEEDLLEIAECLQNFYFEKFGRHGKHTALLKKILKIKQTIPYPGDLKNILKRAFVFSDSNIDGDYLRRLYEDISGHAPKIPDDIPKLKNQGFTVREIELLTGRSKSQVARDLKEIK